jgi:hypothetical protein
MFDVMCCLAFNMTVGTLHVKNLMKKKFFKFLIIKKIFQNNLHQDLHMEKIYKINEVN